MLHSLGSASDLIQIFFTQLSMHAPVSWSQSLHIFTFTISKYVRLRLLLPHCLWTAKDIMETWYVSSPSESTQRLEYRFKTSIRSYNYKIC